MDFYTLRTSVDLAEDQEALNHVLHAVGFFAQPLILGDPVVEGDQTIFRFAVRGTTLDAQEDSLVALICEHPGFDPDTTSVVKASRL